MDKQTRYLLDFYKKQTRFIDREFQFSNMKNFMRVYSSEEYNKTITNGGIYITEGELEGSWVACYEVMVDEGTAVDVEMNFSRKPSLEDAENIRVVREIEEYFRSHSDAYVTVNKQRTHWTKFPHESLKEKWKLFVALKIKNV